MAAKLGTRQGAHAKRASRDAHLYGHTNNDLHKKAAKAHAQAAATHRREGNKIAAARHGLMASMHSGVHRGDAKHESNWAKWRAKHKKG